MPSVKVSPECKDLLRRLLVADPELRMSIEAIREHPWFGQALPTGALHMNEWYISHSSGVDEVKHFTFGYKNPCPKPRA